MDKELETEKEYARLIARNEEIRILKNHSKFRVIIAESVKEYVQLELEEMANQDRIGEIKKFWRKRA
jgi:hypothetical protein